MLRSIAYYPTGSSESHSLFHLIKKWCDTQNFNIESLTTDSPIAYQQAGLNYDVVILDGTIENDGSHNYHFAMPFPVDFYLVFSRSHLPLNFDNKRAVFPLNKGRDTSFLKGKLLYNSPLFIGKDHLSNEELFLWITAQLEDLQDLFERYPETIAKQKSMVAQPFQILKNILFNKTEQFSHSFEIESELKRRGGQIFISYRNTQLKNGLMAADFVHALKERIETNQIEGCENKSVRYYPPNAIASEIMPEQRRWQILTILERYFSEAEEFWIFGTEDYFNSWWTLGELLALSYRLGDSGKGKIPKLRLFSPDIEMPGYGKLKELTNDFLPKLTSKHRKRIARWYVNSDPAQMAPESVIPWRMLSNVPIIGKWGMAGDHVWSRIFWECPILDCPNCRNIGIHENRFNVDDFLWTRGDWFSRFEPFHLLNAEAEFKLACTNCPKEFMVQPTAPSYFWIPPIRREVVAPYYRRIYGFEQETHEQIDFSLVKVPKFVFR